MKFLIFILLLVFLKFASAQNQTIGVVHNSSNVSEGYSLFSHESSNSTYLIDNNGELINKWIFSEKPNLSCYLLENGNVLRTGKTTLEIRDWNNNLVWLYNMRENGLLQHHDIEPLPNGNILCIVTDEYSQKEIIALGRDSAMTDINFKLDKIVELKPIGENDAKMIWEWKFIDHLIQNKDESKPNFGSPKNHPELMWINYDNGNISDWIHLNAIDYNSELEQLMISSKHTNEIYIIDHSTTTLETKSHSGGKSGKGGDFLWRYGNPQVYLGGTSANQKFYAQHDCKWVEKGCKDEGKISVFNNGGDGSSSFSSMHLFSTQLENNQYINATEEWSWHGEILGSTVYLTARGGMHFLPNGNLMICETDIGRFSELNKKGEVVWSYLSPVGEVVYDKDSIATIHNNSIFRAEKYPADYIGFKGKDLSQKGKIKLNE